MYIIGNHMHAHSDESVCTCWICANAFKFSKYLQHHMSTYFEIMKLIREHSRF